MQHTDQSAAPQDMAHGSVAGEKSGPHPAQGCLARIYWMILGNALLVLFSYEIVEQAGALTRVDLYYWLALASLAAVRFIDIRYLRGRTAEGKPATLQDWRRYVALVVAIAGGLWLAVHGVVLFTS